MTTGWPSCEGQTYSTGDITRTNVPNHEHVGFFASIQSPWSTSHALMNYPSTFSSLCYILAQSRTLHPRKRKKNWLNHEFRAVCRHTIEVISTKKQQHVHTDLRTVRCGPHMHNHDILYAPRAHRQRPTPHSLLHQDHNTVCKQQKANHSHSILGNFDLNFWDESTVNI